MICAPITFLHSLRSNQGGVVLPPPTDVTVGPLITPMITASDWIQESFKGARKKEMTRKVCFRA